MKHKETCDFYNKGSNKEIIDRIRNENYNYYISKISWINYKRRNILDEFGVLNNTFFIV